MFISTIPGSPFPHTPLLQADATKTDTLDMLRLLAQPDLQATEKQAAIDAYLSSHPLSTNLSPSMELSCSVIKEIIINQGIYLNGADLLQRLFQFDSKEEKTERFFSFLLHATPQEHNLFLASLHDALRQELNACIETMMEFFNNPSQISPIPFEKSQRTYFLRLLFAQALDRPRSFLIAASLTAHDWKILHDINKGPKEIIDRGLYWMEMLLPFLDTTELSLQEGQPQVCTFLSHASILFEEASMSTQQRANLKRIAEEFPSTILARYYQSLHAPVLEQLPSQKVAHLISYYMALYCSNVILKDLFFKTVQDIWYKMAPARGFQSMFTTFFSFDTAPSCVLIQLTLYNTINSFSRSMILDALLIKPEQAIPQLHEWCKLALSKQLNTLSYPARELTLHEIQKKIMLRAPHCWGPFMNKFTAENTFAENSFQIPFPVIDSLQQKQALALKFLEDLFLENIGHNETISFVARIREDLQAGMARSIWIPKLFETLPSKRWPSLFAYFKEDMTYEAREWLPPEEKWLNMAAQTLLEVSNSFFQENHVHDIGLKALWELMQQTQTTTKVIERFCSLHSFEALIPTLEKLGSLIYSADRAYWHRFLAACIEETQINKTAFIINCLSSFISEKEKLGIKTTPPLEKALYDQPFIKNPQEEMRLLKGLKRGREKDFDEKHGD